MKLDKYGQYPKFNRLEICSFCSKYGEVEYWENECRECFVGWKEVGAQKYLEKNEIKEDNFDKEK